MGTHLLRSARRQHNLTIKQLADVAGIGASTVWRAEHDYPINAESRRRLCAYFSKTTCELGLIQEDQPASQLPAPQAAPYISLSTPAAHPVLQAGNRSHAYEEQVHQRSANSTQGQHIGTWLALNATELSSLFEAGWSLDEVLNSLRVVLRSAQGLPVGVRQKIGQLKDILPNSDRHTSIDERVQLTNAMRQGVAEGWKRFHTMRPSEVLVATQAQLYLVQQTHDLILPEYRSSLYAALYNLTGAALFYQGATEAAQRAYTQAHIAALEGADIWNLAQNLNWQAISANSHGHYDKAIEHIEASFRLINGQQEEQLVRLRAHLLADWAYNAALLQDGNCVEAKLEASSSFLDALGPAEEFDRTRWYQVAGSCMLNLKHYSSAIEHLERSLSLLPSTWINRRVLTLVPLAEAYARRHERDASIAVAENIITLLEEIDSSLLNQSFYNYQQILLKAFPRDQRTQTFVESIRHHPLLA
ncbi:helix-turn-helix domain-containing protein [Dictyobacter arantiisoli]|uniref:HTH cro/C1-type domain-containing protein n=1 Tax=Dictyobacter arantiisoli TaxID=2014874 RepID=A0A5A5TBT8_9CHLR|nr:helix-turn-helix transcriptional regulator [Dictyobacter arantiisoli]GCF08394.1 hypothetical protein KDI_19580 [Dictyobacter arantiisoli]